MHPTTRRTTRRRWGRGARLRRRGRRGHGLQRGQVEVDSRPGAGGEVGRAGGDRVALADRQRRGGPGALGAVREDPEPHRRRAADGLAIAGLGLALLAHAPSAHVVEVEGRQYRRREPGVGTYLGLRGLTTITRHLYREVGVRNGPAVVPVDLRAGIVDGRWAPLAAAAAGHLLQDEPSRDAVKTCEALRVMPYSRCSLDRGGNRLGARWGEIRPEAEDKLAAGFAVPAEATTVSAYFDRVTVPMEEPLLDADRGAVLDADGKPGVQVVYRMAFCGVSTLYDAEGEPLHSARYGRMAAEGHDPIEEAMWGDLEALNIARPDLRMVGLADGAPEMQHMLGRTVGIFDGDVGIAIDFWHVVEKVSDAVRATGRETSYWTQRLKALLRHQDRGQTAP